jgi:hypothetical protein
MAIRPSWHDVFAKNIDAFTEQCESRRTIMLRAFEAIEKIEFKLSFDECQDRANGLKADLRYGENFRREDH